MPPRNVGVVLTHVDRLDQLDASLTRGRFNTLKVVTGWGLADGWTHASISWVAQRVPTLVVRTVAGDPSYARHNGLSLHALPDANTIRAELVPWLVCRKDLWVEIGNEPDAFDHDDNFVWYWRWCLSQTIDLLRRDFPQVKLIAPGLMGGKRADRFYEIACDQFARCDAIGVHAYEYYSFTARNVVRTKALETNLARVRRFCPGKPIWLTEYGINDTKETTQRQKGDRYLKLLEWCKDDVIGATYYHLTARPIDQDQAAYAGYPGVEEGLAKRWWKIEGEN